MRTNLILICFFLASCGNEVQLKKNSLENIDPLTNGQIAAYQKQGIVTKGNPSTLSYQGVTYTVSGYSSKVTQDFLNSLPSGIQVPVIFTGGIDGNQIVVETIKRQ